MEILLILAVGLYGLMVIICSLYINDNFDWPGGLTILASVFAWWFILPVFCIPKLFNK